MKTAAMSANSQRKLTDRDEVLIYGRYEKAKIKVTHFFLFHLDSICCNFYNTLLAKGFGN